jgi:arylsulfatase A-like enzyme
MPLQNGFDHSYYLKDQSRFFSPQVHWKDDVKLPPVKRESGFYGTIAVADAAIGHLKEHATSHGDKPFFHYVASAAPHFPLHALPEDIAPCRDRYAVGWDRIRVQRWQRVQKLGLVKGTLPPVEREIGPPYHFPEHLKILGPAEVNRPLPWADLSNNQKKFQQTKMAIHAAMVERMDKEIGRILKQLRHDNIISLLEVFRRKGKLFLVFEYARAVAELRVPAQQRYIVFLRPQLRQRLVDHVPLSIAHHDGFCKQPGGILEIFCRQRWEFG